MRVTSWTEYSLIIALHLASKRGEGVAPVPARTLADAERLPADFVEQILLRMRRAGLVTSVRGARGGYRLAKDPAEISVRDVMAAAERQVFETNCESHKIDGVRCDPGSFCVIRPVLTELQHRIDDFLGGVTIAAMMQSEAATKELIPLGRS